MMDKVPQTEVFIFYLSFSRVSSGGGFKRKAAAGSTDVRSAPAQETVTATAAAAASA